MRGHCIFVDIFTLKYFYFIVLPMAERVEYTEKWYYNMNNIGISTTLTIQNCSIFGLNTTNRRDVEF